MRSRSAELFVALVATLFGSSAILTANATPAGVPSDRKDVFAARQREARENLHPGNLRQRRPGWAEDEEYASEEGGTLASNAYGNITFSDPRAQAFYVDGKRIPDVDFDAGPSWSGLIPISDDPNETRKLFFWFFPTNAAASDDLIFWTNGGPGCSSLEGFLQENGPISWKPGQFQPTPNPYSWINLSHVLWVEQPVGTGFSQGTPNITNDDELAAQVSGFLVQFLDIFKELKGKNFYVTGESYAGYYVPYIANYLYEHPGQVDLNVRGIWVADPSIGWDIVTEEIPAFPYAKKWQILFNLNSSYLAELQQISDTCGYTGYLDKYLSYPPSGPLPLPNGTYQISDDCDIFGRIAVAATQVNPAWNIYHITDTPPPQWDVLGFPSKQTPIYFNRTDVQDAIHAPHVDWSVCSDVSVFVNGTDTSEPAFLKVLPNVIEKSERSLILHGGLDFVLIAEGTRLVLQNTTWGGLQGFQTAPKNESFVLEPFGVVGMTQTERKLTYVEINLSGHMIPQYAPEAAYKTVQYLLGKIDSL